MVVTVIVMGVRMTHHYDDLHRADVEGGVRARRLRARHRGRLRRIGCALRVQVKSVRPSGCGAEAEPAQKD